MPFGPGFELPGPLAGDADGWTTAVVNTNWGYAVFGVKEWGVERFDSDWNNDTPVWAFEPADLDAAVFDPDNKLFEPFIYWQVLPAPPPYGPLIYIASWDDVSDDPAVFDAVPEDFEDFEEDWGNDPWYPAFVSYIVGDAVEPFIVGTDSYRFRIRLERAGWPTFDATLDATLDTYDTTTALATHLQTLVDAALTAAGGAYAPNDIRFYPEPASGRMAIVNAKSLYKMTIYTGSDDGWPVVLDREVAWDDFRYFEEDLLDVADYVWTGQHNSHTYHEERYERDWFNSDTSIPWEHLFYFVPWFDGSVVLPLSLSIQLGVNDELSFRIREWATANVTASGVLTIPAGAYGSVALATAVQLQIDAWLVGVGAPFWVGQITADVSPEGKLRIINTGLADFVVYATDEGTSFWNEVGVAYDDPAHVEQYEHAVSARWREDETLEAAIFNASPPPVPVPYENFESKW